MAQPVKLTSQAIRPKTETVQGCAALPPHADQTLTEQPRLPGQVAQQVNNY
ncbi:MAG: hypothetical protein ACMX3H_18095 [Sodalis sp. (in: enterobacteria)]|uniref:hypothetical protein n=1 Tax=Sodalis sp. (in: enterobacteria) TaxID=1898979 RepID=UPI0039E2F5B5